MSGDYYDEKDDITRYWELRYIEWLKNPNWGVFETKDAWFKERFAHIIGEGPEPSPTLGGVRGADLIGGHFVSGTVLDFGCGNAMYAVPLLRRFEKYVGVDTSFTAIEIAKIYFGENSRSGLRERMTLKQFQDLGSELDYLFYNFNQRFDCVVSITVLQHQPVSFRKRMINTIKRVLKPGGLYVGLEMQGHTGPYDMPPMAEDEWIREWEPLKIVKDIPAAHPQWAEDNVWYGRMP